MKKTYIRRNLKSKEEIFRSWGGPGFGYGPSGFSPGGFGLENFAFGEYGLGNSDLVQVPKRGFLGPTRFLGNGAVANVGDNRWFYLITEVGIMANQNQDIGLRDLHG